VFTSTVSDAAPSFNCTLTSEELRNVYSQVLLCCLGESLSRDSYGVMPDPDRRESIAATAVCLRFKCDSLVGIEEGHLGVGYYSAARILYRSGD